MSLINRIKDRIALELDARDWSRQVKNIGGSDLPPLKSTIFVCDVLTMVATAKVQAIYAAALRARGVGLCVLLRNSDKFIENIYRCAVPDVAFVYLNDMMDELGREGFTQAAQKAWASFETIQDILELEVDGFRVGKNALSYTVRTFRIGQIDLQNTDHRDKFIEILSESLCVVEVSKSLISRVQPEYALFVEKGYTPAGELFDACVNAGVRCVQWISAPETGKLIFKAYSAKNRSLHPLALSDAGWAQVQDPAQWTDDKRDQVINKLRSHYESGSWYNRQQLQTGKSILSSAEVSDLLGLDKTKKTAIIFSHIFYDATFFYGESLYSDYKEWLVETVRHAIDNPHMNWVVKVHPVNVWRSAMDGQKMEQLEKQALEDEFGLLPDHIKIMPADTKINTFSLFSLVDFGITVRGTIGMELPCFGVPVVTAGSGRYAGRGFTIDPQTPEEYRSILMSLHERDGMTPQELKQAVQYTYGTFYLRPVPMKSYEMVYDARSYGSTALTINTFYHSERATVYQQGFGEDVEYIIDWVMGDQDDLMW